VKEETKNRLANVLNRYDEEQSGAKKQAQETQTAQEELLQAFGHLRTEVIRPSMEAIGTVLQTRGHEYKIVEEDVSTDAPGTQQDLMISMYIFPSRAGAQATTRELLHFPHISFRPDPYWRRIIIHTSNVTLTYGGLSGGRGEYSISQITSEFVEKELVQIVEEILNK
jgi:hypothetical protein